MDLHTKNQRQRNNPSNYTVSDGNGAKVKATNSFELEAVNDAAELTGDQATLAKGKEDNAYILQESDLLKGFTDPDGDTLQVENLQASSGSLKNNNDGTWTYTPKTNDNGTIKLNYTVSDGNGAKVKATNSFELEAVRDAAELTGDQATLAKGKEDNAYILQESDLLKGFTDPDGDTLQVENLQASSGSLKNTMTAHGLTHQNQRQRNNQAQLHR